jgi:protein phosphatase
LSRSGPNSTGGAVRVHGLTHVGSVREANEDSMIVDHAHGLYAVFDGMGGASAGDIASQKARDVVKEYVRARRTAMDPRACIDAALNAASAAVHAEALSRRDRRGMGTTAVVAMLVDDRRVVIGHVGDSRAYLLREGRLAQLTSDHTVVAEMLAQNAITPEEAEVHAYRSVLSRNLGARPETRVDLCEVILQRGDRLLLCSDGLYGFTSTESIQQLLGSTDAPEQVGKDLIEAALRGGGGDNVTVVVIEAGVAAVPRTTQLVRTTGSVSWWARRERFFEAARASGLASNPICAVLSPEEAVGIVAGNFVEALFHDLEKATTVNVWTYAENLAHGWLGRGGGWAPLRLLLDILHHSCTQVIADIRRDDAELALIVEAAVTRELTVCEMAVGGVLGEQLRAIEAELVKRYAEKQAASEAKRVETGKPFLDQPTMPFLRNDKKPEAAAPEVRPVLDAALRAAMQRERDPAVHDLLARLHRLAVDVAPAAAVTVDARDLFAIRPLEDRTISPLFDAIDRARRGLIDAVRGGPATAVQVAAVRQLALAAHRLAASIAGLVVEAAQPGSDKLREAVKQTSALRSEVGKTEARIAALERKFATVYDPMAGKIGDGSSWGGPR